jgi:hypothetical protein
MLGEQLVVPTESEDTFIATLDKTKVDRNKSKIKFLNDQDTFVIKKLVLVFLLGSTSHFGSGV